MIERGDKTPINAENRYYYVSLRLEYAKSDDIRSVSVTPPSIDPGSYCHF
jgi:hypothetical protein